jgi:hypothetical protein
MKLFKYYNILWEADEIYIIRNNARWEKTPLMKVKLEAVYERVLEFTTLHPTEARSFMLTKSDFETFGAWEMVERI